VTRVDFYILQDVEHTAMHRFACRLAAKAMLSGTRAYLHTTTPAHAQELDELMWLYPPNRFIPHGVLGAPEGKGAPVVIGPQSVPAEQLPAEGLLINLTNEVPAFPGRFDRVAEIVVQQTRVAGRARYRFYRERGYPLFHHQLDEWEA